MQKCLICGKSVPSKRGLANHIRTHGINPSQYKKRFDKELSEGLIEGSDFLECPLCNKKVKLLKSHLRRTHNLSYSEIDEMQVKTSCDKVHEKLSSAIAISWESRDRESIGSKISLTKSERWTPEDTKRLYEARVKSGCYNIIGKKRNQHLIDKYETYEEYLEAVSSRLYGNHGTRVYSEDSYGPVMYRSSYEYKLSRILNELLISYKYEPKWFKYFDSVKGKYRRYCPDFLIESKNLILEVKPSRFIEEATVLEKKAAVESEGYRFKFITESELNIESIKSIMI